MTREPPAPAASGAAGRLTRETPVEDGLAPPALYRAMAVILLAIALAVLDATLISVALPSIAADLKATPTAAIWVVNAYQIAIVVTLLPLATLGDKVGYRRIYRIGLVVFIGASVGCLLADTITELAIARAVQGLGAAGIMSVNAALVRLIYPRRWLARGIALNSFLVAGASAIGPTIAAGILAVSSWQWLFAINIPLGLAALTGAMLYLPASRKTTAAFDLASAALSMLTFGLVFVGVDAIAHLEWTGSTAAMLAAGIVIGIVFVRRQLREPLPLLPVDLLRIPVFALSMGTSILSFAAQMIAFIALPFYLQHSLGRTAVETGLLMTPWPVALMLAAPVSARLLERYPAGALGGVGLSIFATGLAALALLPAAPTTLDIGWRMALCGLGFGLFQAPNNHTILTAGPAHRSGGASGMLGTARLTGQTLGATVVTLSFALAPQRIGQALAVAAVLAATGAVVSALRVRAARGSATRG